MNVGELRNAIENLPNDMPVFFRRVAPVAGNIETAGSANKDTFSSFGVVQDCLIIEPITDDEDGEAQQTRVPDVCPADGGKHSWHPNKDNYLIYSCRKCGARG